MKLNLGSGEGSLEGYENLDINDDKEIYPLDYPDAVADEIRASHVLEHFSHKETKDVLIEWTRVLKPGGILRVAVPDFEWIAKHYLSGQDIPVQSYVSGGQEDENDYHKTIFDYEVLHGLMQEIGLKNIHPWESPISDCASFDVSLNLVGTKADPINLDIVKGMKVGASMSVPRLGFMDNFFCSFEALLPLRIPIRKHTGAFWGQCLERCIDEWIAEDKEWVLTIDYDTIFSRAHVEELLQLAYKHPEADAIAPLQASRTKDTTLMTIRGEDGKNKAEVKRTDFDKDLMKIATAHFGLTLIKVEKIKQMDRPLFLGVPSKEGLWDDDRVDDDIYFWKQWEKAGNTLYLANRVAVGHAELMIRWPDEDLQTIYQHPLEFHDKGVPKEIWK